MNAPARECQTRRTGEELEGDWKGGWKVLTHLQKGVEPSLSL